MAERLRLYTPAAWERGRQVDMAALQQWEAERIRLLYLRLLDMVDDPDYCRSCGYEDLGHAARHLLCGARAAVREERERRERRWSSPGPGSVGGGAAPAEEAPNPSPAGGDRTGGAHG